MEALGVDLTQYVVSASIEAVKPEIAAKEQT